MARRHLMESVYCKTFWLLKGVLIIHLFLYKNIFRSRCYITENFKIMEGYQNCRGQIAVKSPGKRDTVTLIHPMTYKTQLEAWSDPI